MNNLTLVEILEKIVSYTGINPQLKSSLQKGISSEEIASKLNNFPFILPQEAQLLYQWHNGMKMESDCELFYYHSFLSLDQALAIRNEWLKLNQDWSIYPINILPLFSFEGEYYGIECSEKEQRSGLIWFIYHANFPVYNSLKMMLFSILKCYQKGAYFPIFKHNYLETIVKEKEVAEIKLKYNPIRQQNFDLLNTQQNFYYHP